MDTLICTTINGEQRALNYSIGVMFKLNEKFGDANGFLELLSDDGAKGFEALVFFLVEAVNDAELLRRSYGYDPLPLLTAEDLTLHMSPAEQVNLMAAAVAAYEVGIGRDVKEVQNNEVDIGLLELKKKKSTEA